jgi:hypothetical protein
MPTTTKSDQGCTVQLLPGQLCGAEARWEVTSSCGEDQHTEHCLACAQCLADFAFAGGVYCAILTGEELCTKPVKTYSATLLATEA